MKKIILSLLVALTVTTGAWAQTGDVTMTNTGDTYSGTFSMPAYDVDVTTELWYKLSATADNSATADKIDIFLDRTLSSGAWNTFCAPFNAAIPSGWTVKQLSSTSYNADTQMLTLNFSDASSIVAGTPYIVKVDADIEDPTFENVSQDWTANPVNKNYVTFVPVLTPTTLTANDKTKIYLGGENTLYYPSKDVTVNGFRAYFVLNNGINAGDVTTSRIVLNFGDETTAVFDLNDKSEMINDNWYSLDGRRLSGKSAQRGVYINKGKKIIIK